MFDFKKLYEYRQSSTAIFLGSGSSINGITPKEWKAIQKADIWTVNNWIYHPTIVPDFYHIEVKHYNYDLMSRRIREKAEAYHEVKFIFPRGKTIKMKDGGRLPLHAVALDTMLKFDYALASRDPKRTDNPFHARYKLHPNQLTKSYDMSITAVFELMYRMGYEKIITFGIDLSNSLYFWTGGDPKYGEVHHQTNKAHEGRPPESPHATHQIKDFLVDFSRCKMEPKGRAIFVGHKNTALYPLLPFISVGTL